MFFDFSSITNDPSGSVAAIATISTVGFALSLGIATVGSTAFSALSSEKELDIITDRTRKIISKFAKPAYIYAYSGSSLIYMGSAFVLLLYFLSSDTSFLYLSALILSVAVLTTITISAILLWNAATTSQEELNKVKRALDYANQSLRFVRSRTHPCDSCGALNSIWSKFCANCGKPMSEKDPESIDSERGKKHNRK